MDALPGRQVHGVAIFRPDGKDQERPGHQPHQSAGVAGRVTGQPVETYRNAAMDRGTEIEGEARDAYSFETGLTVDECGSIDHPTIAMCAASPDGLVGAVGLVEIKCHAAMAKHLDALRTGSHAQEYRWQLQHQMMVTGREWVDAVSYDPRYPEGLQLAIKRVFRDEAAIAELVAEIAAGEAEVQAIVAELNNMRKS
jgi:predicted phage-related endonuclease